MSGDAGCGKSVLTSFLIEELTKDVSNDNTSVCYFFFKDDNTEQRSTASAFRSLIYQVFKYDLSLVRHAMPQFQLEGRKYANEFLILWDILVAVAADESQGRNILCVLDGLDECEGVERIQMIQHLEKFYDNSTRSSSASGWFLKFLITSRPGVLLEDTFFNLPTIRLRAEDEISGISYDIKLVVQDTISFIGQRRRIPADQQQDLVKQITKYADRTFLWVTFVLQRILTSERFSKAATKELVQTMPPDLDGIYNKMLSESSRSQYTRKILEIVVGAFRPLPLDELNVAFVIEPQTEFEENLDLEPDIQSTMRSLCGSFLRVVESKVYLVHQTARELLLSSEDTRTYTARDRATVGPWKQSLDSRQTHEIWAQICRWHLMFRVFDENPFYVANEPNDNLLQDHASKYASHHTLLSYTARYWSDHFRIWGVSHKDPRLDAFLALYEPDTKRFKNWFQIYWVTVYTWSLGPVDNTPILVAASLGHVEVVKKLLTVNESAISRLRSLFIRQEDDPINAKNEDGCSALSEAAFNGHLETVKYLLTLRNIDVNIQDSLLQTPLIRATRGGHYEIAKMLLSREDIITDARADRKETALIDAASQGYADIAQLLMNRKDVDINAADYYGETPIYNAARHGWIDIVCALMKRPEIELDLVETKTSVISAAAACGNEKIFQIVMEFAKQRKSGLNIKRAVFDAAENGSTKILQRLLELDRSLLEARNDEFQTPLTLAAKGGQIETTRFSLT